MNEPFAPNFERMEAELAEVTALHDTSRTRPRTVSLRRRIDDLRDSAGASPRQGHDQETALEAPAREDASAQSIDLVNHPPHYTQHPSGVECIEITEWMNFNLGNCVKYIWRNGLKDATPILRDLKKARWYLDREIARLERMGLND
jgi:hypothetical protein